MTDQRTATTEAPAEMSEDERVGAATPAAATPAAATPAPAGPSAATSAPSATAATAAGANRAPEGDGRPLDTRDLRAAQAAPNARPAPADDQPAGAVDVDAPLFDEAAAEQLRERWIDIQTEFVDAPREAVEKADGLVAEVLQQLTETFAQERDRLEAGWSGRAGEGEAGQAEPSTEDLRQAIRRYRSFFNRLLAV